MGISLGLVGLGAFGSEFADLFQSHPAVDRVALCDREPERVARFAEKSSFQDKFDPSDAYNSFEDICRADLDALVIITQPWLHAEQAVQAMEAGKHVYSAVPVVQLPDGDEILAWCDRIVETCRRTGLHYMLGETTYYRPQAMYCRRRAREGAFGDFVYAEGEYFHDVDDPGCNLREVAQQRLNSQAGREWLQHWQRQGERKVVSGPMHYPTHSTSGPICVMGAHMVKVCAWPYYNRTGDEFFQHGPSNETALFLLSNGATARICEYREIGHDGRECFRIYGTQGSFENDAWCDKHGATPVSVEEMRDPLPPEVVEAFREVAGGGDLYGGHGGSHAFLVHEFVDAIASGRRPAINAWEAVRYMAAGVAAHRSAMREGEVLEVPDWGDAPG
ncbi:MAG: Gfo/Idh/MocA family oxidoreductase [Armatimonadetes bacterium]|nr:Gfo/Idh/MocA family oxidoreductase [Armatimonadota bacterium]